VTILLKLEGLTKAYPGVIANDDVSFEVKAGEIHALLGENGAGKSTLVKMIYGLVRPDKGKMTFNGEVFQPAEPRAARASGVAMVFQHFSLFDALSVAENISLGMENPPSRRELSARIREVSNDYKLPLDPNRIIGDLSVGERQRVEIIRCLLQNPKLLIMDEPTSVLTPQEVDVLFETLRKLASEGTSILYISHKLEEIRSLCDQATILRLGKVIDSCVPSEQTARKLAEMMVGQALITPTRKDQKTGDVVLKVSNLTVPSSNPFGTTLKNIALAVRSGEVLGIGGVAGNGQDELLLALSGETRVAQDEISVDGKPVGNLGPNERRKLGLLTAPEERLGHSAAPDMSLVENTMLTAAVRENLARNGFLRWNAAKDFAETIVKKFDVRTPSVNNAAKSLSGGNLQKFVIGREVLQNPRVLVINQPTWGVDASAAADIRQALMFLAEEGAAVVVVSQDLDELLEVSDQLAILNEGRLTSPVATASLNMDDIGLMMGGGAQTEMEAQHVSS